MAAGVKPPRPPDSGCGAAPLTATACFGSRHCHPPVAQRQAAGDGGAAVPIALTVHRPAPSFRCDELRVLPEGNLRGGDPWTLAQAWSK